MIVVYVKAQWILLPGGETSTWNLLMQFPSDSALGLGMGMDMDVVRNIARLDAAKPRLMCPN